MTMVIAQNHRQARRWPRTPNQIEIVPVKKGNIIIMTTPQAFLSQCFALSQGSAPRFS
jgi:hypothetical protein